VKNKPNSNPIVKRPKIIANPFNKMNYKDFIPVAPKKQTQTKPIFVYPCLFIFTLYNLPEKNKSRFNFNGDYKKWQMHLKQMQ
jgi:hypothetical protein